MLKKLIVSVLAVFVLLSLGLAPGADAVERKDVLVIGMATSDIISLDPAKAFEFSGVGLVAQIYDRLLDFPAGKYDKPEFSLAKSYDVSPDGKTWTFLLSAGGHPERPAVIYPDPIRHNAGLRKSNRPLYGPGIVG
jgi:peptide/nickel transport system substrate-binding protein